MGDRRQQPGFQPILQVPGEREGLRSLPGFRWVWELHRDAAFIASGRLQCGLGVEGNRSRPERVYHPVGVQHRARRHIGHQPARSHDRHGARVWTRSAGVHHQRLPDPRPRRRHAPRPSAVRRHRLPGADLRPAGYRLRQPRGPRRLERQLHRRVCRWPVPADRHPVRPGQRGGFPDPRELQRSELRSREHTNPGADRRLARDRGDRRPGARLRGRERLDQRRQRGPLLPDVAPPATGPPPHRGNRGSLSSKPRGALPASSPTSTPSWAIRS